MGVGAGVGETVGIWTDDRGEGPINTSGSSIFFGAGADAGVDERAGASLMSSTCRTC